MKGWYTDSTGEHLYCFTPSGWVSFAPIPTQRHKQTFHNIPRPMALDDITYQLEKVTVYSCGLIIMLTVSSPIDYSQCEEDPLSMEAFFVPAVQVLHPRQCTNTKRGHNPRSCSGHE